MLKIKPPDYRFCPFCGQKITTRVEEGSQRKFCQSCSWTYYPHVAGAAASIILKGNKILLTKRNRNPYKNTWAIPAGFIAFGEHPEETLCRELKEETGLTVKKAKLFKIIQNEDDPRSPGHFSFFYKVSVSGKKLNSDQEENADLEWFPIKKPPIIGWKSHKQILKLLQQRKM